MFSQDLDIKLILNWANQQKMLKREVLYVNIFVKYTALYKVYMVFHAAKNQRGRDQVKVCQFSLIVFK